MSNSNKTNTKKIALILGPALFLAIALLLSTVTSFKVGAAIGTVVWMGCWWVFLPVDIGVTAFIPIIVNTMFSLVPMSGIISKYASETVFLLLGAELITLTWEYTGLDKRLALKSLVLIGPSLKQQVLVWFVASAVLSMFLPNAVVCAMLVPIAIAMLRFIKYEDISGLTDHRSRTAAIILSAIAWGSGVGGLGSPLGGAMNLVAIEYLEGLTGHEYMYVDWCIRLIPMLVLILIVDYVIMRIVMPKNVSLDGSKSYFKELYAQLPAMSRDEKVCLAIFIAAVAFCFLRPLYDGIIPGLKPAYVFLTFGILMFIIPRRETGGKMLEWKSAQGKILWGMIYMFAGGMALGELVTGTGAADEIANLVMKFNLSGGFTTVLVFVVFTVVLSEISNNTSAAAIAIPIVISVCNGIGSNPYPFIYITIAAYNCAYMLPTTVRAIPVGYGLSPKFLMKNGFLLTVITIALVTIAGYLLMRFWPMYSIA